MNKIDVRKMAINFGVENLTDFELVKLLIGSGHNNNSVDDISEKFISKYRNISELDFVKIEEIKSIRGIGQNKALLIKAAVEFGKRVQFSKTIRYQSVNSSKKIGDLLINKLSGVDQELVIVIFLDTKNQIIKMDNIFKGTLNTATVHPRDIFRKALQLSAAKFIISHNHPSGVTTASRQDIDFTNRLLKCSELIGCEMLDHLIIGKESYFSFKEESLI